jgi:signal transduction histidine kinase
LWLGSQDRLAEAGRAVLDEEADRAHVAAALLETVGTAMVTVRYAAEQVAAGRAAAGDLDEPVRAALAAVREAHRDLRAHALEAGLRAALEGLAAQTRADRPDDGRPPLRLSVEASDPALDAVAPPVAVTLERTAQAVLRAAAGHARLWAGVDGSTVKLRVESADNAYDAGELDRWARRVSALGGTLRTGPGGVELDLPAQPSAEGHHDHSPDL